MAQDGINLAVEIGPGASDVSLQWVGGQLPWQVFRSTDPATVTDPANRLGDTDLQAWVDSPPAAELIFYRVTSCGSPGSPSPHGCSNCDFCDLWGLSWDAVACARHYVVRWKCGTFNPEQVWNVGNTTMVDDICFDIGMCDGGTCVAGGSVQYIRVEACNPSGCSAAASVPSNETPGSCGGGCCFP